MYIVCLFWYYTTYVHIYIFCKICVGAYGDSTYGSLVYCYGLVALSISTVWSFPLLCFQFCVNKNNFALQEAGYKLVCYMTRLLAVGVLAREPGYFKICATSVCHVSASTATIRANNHLIKPKMICWTHGNTKPVLDLSQHALILTDGMSVHVIHSQKQWYYLVANVAMYVLFLWRY